MAIPPHRMEDFTDLEIQRFNELLDTTLPKIDPTTKELDNNSQPTDEEKCMFDLLKNVSPRGDYLKNMINDIMYNNAQPTENIRTYLRRYFANVYNEAVNSLELDDGSVVIDRYLRQTQGGRRRRNTLRRVRKGKKAKRTMRRGKNSKKSAKRRKSSTRKRSTKRR